MVDGHSCCAGAHSLDFIDIEEPMFSFFKRRRSSTDFWRWLAANTSRIQGGGRNALGHFSIEISRTFERSFPDLTWEITSAETGPWRFCISADGNVELFAQVRETVAAAPHIEHWMIDAFRQRGSLDAVIEMNGKKLSYDDIWCEVAPVGSKANVTMCVNGLTEANAEQVLGAALILLDNALGEHDSIVRIADLSNRPLSTNPVRSATFFPLSDLPAYIDRLGNNGSI
jgi:hypothetical protein